MPRTNSKKRYDGFDGRVRLIGISFVIGMGVLIVQLWNIQIIHGQA